MKFVNRTKERKYIKELFEQINAEKGTCIWIEGTSGAGKSHFIKYMKQQSDIPVYKFEGCSWCYKCNKSTIDKEYQMLIDILCDFQYIDSTKFNNFLVNYFDNINDISWVEIIASIIPNIKATAWAKDLLSKSSEPVVTSKMDISNRLYKSGLRNFLARAVIYYLTEVKNMKNVVFVVDDACWLDQNSIDTIILMLNLIKYNNNLLLNISFIILTRPENELEEGRENYSILEKGFEEIYDDIKYIKIKNFDFKATYEYIKIMDKKYDDKITHDIFKFTSGNPQELFQSLKFNDDDLEDLVKSEFDGNCNNYTSIELITRLAMKNIYCMPIICSISLLHQKMKRSWLTIIINEFCKNIIAAPYDTEIYEQSIRLLSDNNIIFSDYDTIEIVHDSIREIAIDYIKNNGEYEAYIKCLIDGLKNIEQNSDIFTKEIMQLYSEFSPKLCFDFFIQYKNITKLMSNDGIMRTVIKSLIVEKSIYTTENITHYIVPIILEYCVKMSYYDWGYSIGESIWVKIYELPRKTLYYYYVYFAKILIDKGILINNKSCNAINIVESALSLSDLSSNEKIELYLLAMSSYEHLLDFDNIKKYNNLAYELIKESDISALNHCMFLRNQGLIKSHRELGEIYKESVTYANKINDFYKKYLMLGTCYNNLGLFYLYSNDVENGIKNFKKAKENFEIIGYDTFRTLNNIGICYFLKGDTQIAFDCLVQAKNLNLDCTFEKLCIQSNLSILEYKLGKKETAKDILKYIIDDYKGNQKQTTDDLVYSSAMANLGYIFYKEEDYVNSVKLYRESLFFNYRYDNSLQHQKREEMIKLNLSKMEIFEKSTVLVDINDDSTNIFSKMYALIPFAYYII